MNALMKPKLFYRWGLSLLLSLGGLQACSAEVDPATQNWPTECVGRMQIRLPGPADTAAFSFNRMQEHIKEPGLRVGFTFPDNIPAPFANGLAISHPLSEAEKAALLATALEQKKRVVANNQQRKKRGVEFLDIADLPAPPFDAKSTIGWLANGKGIAVHRLIGDSLTKWSEDLSDADLILKARPRPIFEVPKEPGLCLPYIFVPDDGKARRGLSMSYRLKDHPDIQITLTDASAFDPKSNRSYAGDEKKIERQNALAEPDPEIADFWGQWLTMARKYESQWLVPDTTRPVTLAGYEGRQSFVRLTMDDGTLNYGYYAVVRGNPDATEDTPDLRLNIQQDVRQAEGKTPLTKEQFIEMAQAIAKSVQRRPVSQN